MTISALLIFAVVFAGEAAARKSLAHALWSAAFLVVALFTGGQP